MLLEAGRLAEARSGQSIRGPGEQHLEVSVLTVARSCVSHGAGGSSVPWRACPAAAPWWQQDCWRLVTCGSLWALEGTEGSILGLLCCSDW
jgi:hypothetical protein